MANGLGEQAINKMAEIAIASQLEGSEELDVNIKTDPGQLSKGELESFAIEGEGLVLEEDLRVEEMVVEIDDIAINPMQAIFGNLQLKHPTQGRADLLLTEADLNRAFNSETLGKQMQDLQVQVNGNLVTLHIQEVNCRLLSEGRVAIDADILQQPQGQQRLVSFTAIPKIRAEGRKISLEDIQYAEGKELSPELTEALVEKAKEILDLSNFEMEGIALQVHHLEVEAGTLRLEAVANVTQLPSK